MLNVVDFGCGKGNLANGLRALGVDAWGCDIDPYWDEDQPYLLPIRKDPYTLPFDDASVDVVLSTSVLEHAQNTAELFTEIKRILRPGGCAFHIYPSKWYLPWEPHIYVPLVNFFWPSTPRWWLAFWALIGVRNEFQQGLEWREVTRRNVDYCRKGLCYLPEKTYRRISTEVFGNFDWPMDFYLSNGDGGAAALYKRFPLKSLVAWACKKTRMVLIIHRKHAQ